MLQLAESVSKIVSNNPDNFCRGEMKAWMCLNWRNCISPSKGWAAG